MSHKIIINRTQIVPSLTVLDGFQMAQIYKRPNQKRDYALQRFDHALRLSISEPTAWEARMPFLFMLNDDCSDGAPGFRLESSTKDDQAARKSRKKPFLRKFSLSGLGEHHTLTLLEH